MIRPVNYYDVLLFYEVIDLLWPWLWVGVLFTVFGNYMELCAWPAKLVIAYEESLS